MSDKTLIVYFFVGGMLVYDIELVFKFYQPIGAKKLSDQFMTASGFRGKKLLLEKL